MPVALASVALMAAGVPVSETELVPLFAMPPGHAAGDVGVHGDGAVGRRERHSQRHGREGRVFGVADHDARQRQVGVFEDRVERAGQGDRRRVVHRADGDVDRAADVEAGDPNGGIGRIVAVIAQVVHGHAKRSAPL